MRFRVGRFHQHSKFWPILARFVDYYSLFWGPGVISTINEPRGGLRIGLQHLLFWGPRAISMVVELQGALTCQSSTLTVSADSGSFRGLLLTVLGSRSDFHG